MNDSFLASDKTIPCFLRDHADWHGGVSHYGFWAVLVDNDEWLGLLHEARLHMVRFIHPGYRRGPHITLAACGLISEHHFSSEDLKRQSAALSEAGVAPFALGTAGLDSFESAPYLAVEDPSGSLARIRSALTAVSGEDNSPARYRPHVTLGLYNGAFDTKQVARHLEEFRHGPIDPLRVTELAFCAYETKDIQGPFEVIMRVGLEAGGE